MKVLITGSCGQLAEELIKIKPEGIEIFALNRTQLDLFFESECKNVINSIKPDCIINCAALTNVDKAESEKEYSMAINGKAVEVLSREINKIGGRLIQISTDYVFDGVNKNTPYATYDKRNPCSIYGISKAYGEESVERIFEGTNRGIIVRTSWLMGPKGKNFALTMLNLHSKKNELKVIYDQIGSPTSTIFLANSIWEIVSLDKDVPEQKENKVPIFHIANSGIASWYDLSVAIGEIAKRKNLISKKAHVLPISSEEYNSIAKRPYFSVLETNTSLKQLNLNLLHWYEAIDEIFENIQIKR